MIYINDLHKSFGELEVLRGINEHIAPGEKVGEITLSHALDKGEYQAKLKYECFTLQDKSPLNGAEIDLAINVN